MRERPSAPTPPTPPTIDSACQPPSSPLPFEVSKMHATQIRAQLATTSLEKEPPHVDPDPHQANKIVEVALAKAREMKIKPLAVAVLDQSGHVKSMQREDGASMFRCDVAIGKAWASVGMGVASRTLLQRAKENPQFFGALSATAQGKFLPQTGAVVIKDA